MAWASWLSASELELLLREDFFHLDPTTEYLGISGTRGWAELVARSRGVLACSEEAAALYELSGARVVRALGTGQEVRPGDVVLRAEGPASSLHRAWRAAQALVAYASGVATYAREMVERARAARAGVVVAVTRQTPPGPRKVWFKAAIAGGAIVHRQGVSDEILVFKNHLSLLGAGVGEAVRRLVARVGYKAVGVEVGTLEEALEALEAGARYVQFDRADPATLGRWVREIKARFPEARVGAAGGITAENVADYARAGVDVVVTSAPFRAPPLDFTTAMGR